MCIHTRWTFTRDRLRLLPKHDKSVKMLQKLKRIIVRELFFMDNVLHSTELVFSSNQF